MAEVIEGVQRTHVLQRIPSSLFSGAAGEISAGVALALHDDDGMYHGNDVHYLSCGASAYNVLHSALAIARLQPRCILDFGAGAGRVTRWLRAGYPEAEITATDIRAKDVEFCARTFSATPWVSGVDIDALEAERRFDVIWVGSVITHLCEEQSVKLAQKLFGWLNPQGVLAMSVHGRFVAHRAGEFAQYGLPPQRWEAVEQGCRAGGFGYADYEGQDGYGISLSSLQWTAALTEKIPGSRLVLLSERAWDDHHDVVVLQNKPVDLPV